eukprot:1145320-Prorocentrum_minimum.AAC.2
MDQSDAGRTGVFSRWTNQGGAHLRVQRGDRLRVPGYIPTMDQSDAGIQVYSHDGPIGAGLTSVYSESELSEYTALLEVNTKVPLPFHSFVAALRPHTPHDESYSHTHGAASYSHRAIGSRLSRGLSPGLQIWTGSFPQSPICTLFLISITKPAHGTQQRHRQRASGFPLVHRANIPVLPASDWCVGGLHRSVRTPHGVAGSTDEASMDVGQRGTYVISPA